MTLFTHRLYPAVDAPHEIGERGLSSAFRLIWHSFSFRVDPLSFVVCSQGGVHLYLGLILLASLEDQCPFNSFTRRSCSGRVFALLVTYHCCIVIIQVMFDASSATVTRSSSLQCLPDFWEVVKASEVARALFMLRHCAYAWSTLGPILVGSSQFGVISWCRCVGNPDHRHRFTAPRRVCPPVTVLCVPHVPAHPAFPSLLGFVSTSFLNNIC